MHFKHRQFLTGGGRLLEHQAGILQRLPDTAFGRKVIAHHLWPFGFHHLGIRSRTARDVQECDGIKPEALGENEAFRKRQAIEAKDQIDGKLGAAAIANIADMLRGDGAGLHTPEGAERKAYTARTFSQPSADFVKRLSDRPDTVGSRQYTRVLALGGGLPVKAGNEVVGAVGVSGSPGKDDVCSQAGIDKVAEQLR